jgi:hypothetical protein
VNQVGSGRKKEEPLVIVKRTKMTMMQTPSHAEAVKSTSALAICTENEISKNKRT